MRANTNVASINYHYRSKEELYRAAVLAALHPPASIEKAIAFVETPPDREKRLHNFVARLISATEPDEAEDKQRLRLIAWEMLSPTGILKSPLHGDATLYLHEAECVVREFLPDTASASEVMMHALWLIGQCLIFRQHETATASDRPTNEAIVENVTGLALKALAMR